VTLRKKNRVAEKIKMIQKRETAATTRKKCLTTEKWLTKTLCENFFLSPGGRG